MSLTSAARSLTLALPPILVTASLLVAVLGVSWLWAFWLLGVAIWIEVGL